MSGRIKAGDCRRKPAAGLATLLLCGTVLAGVPVATDQVLCRWSRAGGLELIAREGVTAVPGEPGATFGVFQHTAASPGGSVMLQAILSSGGYGVFRDLGSGLEKVVRTGDTVTIAGSPRTALGILSYPDTATPFKTTGGFGLPINDQGALYLVLSLGGGQYEGRIYPPN